MFGSAIEEQTLSAAGIENAASLIAVTPNNEVNVLAAQLANDQGVGEVAMLVSDAEANSFGAILEEAGVRRLFPGDVDIMAWDYELASGSATKREYVVEGDEDTSWLTRASREVLPLAVVRTGEVKPFTGDIDPGDTVIYVTTDPKRAMAMAGVDALN